MLPYYLSIEKVLTAYQKKDLASKSDLNFPLPLKEKIAQGMVISSYFRKLPTSFSLKDASFVDKAARLFQLEEDISNNLNNCYVKNGLLYYSFKRINYTTEMPFMLTKLKEDEIESCFWFRRGYTVKEIIGYTRSGLLVIAPHGKELYFKNKWECSCDQSTYKKRCKHLVMLNFYLNNRYELFKLSQS